MDSKKKSAKTSNPATKSSSEIYKSLIDNSNSAIFLSKPTGEIIEVNAAAEKMFGYNKTEILKLGRQGIIDHTDTNLHVLLDERKETGKSHGELTGIRNNGEKFPAEFTSSIFTDYAGEEYTCTIMQDISSRKNIEQEMLLMLNNTEECFILLDKELLILNFNKQFKELYKKFFKLSIEKGRSILNFVKPERLEQVKKIYREALDGKIIYKVLDTKDEQGENNYFQIKYAPSRNEAKDIIGVFISIRNITEETRSANEAAERQKKVEQAEVNYRELFEKANDGIFIHELQTGKIIDANKKACEIFGLERIEIINGGLERLANGSKQFSVKELNSKFQQSGEDRPQVFEWVAQHSSGKLNWVEVSLQKATIGGSERILAYYRLINDRKNAASATELQRKNEEALINNTDDLIWSIDNHYNIIAANNAYLSMINSISPKVIKVGEGVLIEEFGEALNNKWKQYYERALAGEKYTIEEKYIHPLTNTSFYGLISFNPIFTEEKVTGIACYSKNITELTENQLAIKATKIELDNVMASSQDMICTVAKNNSIVRISAACEIILGYKPEELIGKYIFDFVYYEDRERTKYDAQEVMTGNNKPNYYNRYVRKDGSLVYLEWTAKWDEHSQMRYGVARDVTAKIEAENKLKRSEKRFKSLVQDGSDMIAIMNVNGDYTYVSPTTYDKLGFDPQSTEIYNAFDFIHPDDIELVKEHILLLEHNKRITLPHFRLKNNAGEWLWVETTLANFIKEPSINGIVINARDVTEKKNIEQVLIETKEDYKNLFENSPAPMFIFDFETLKIIDCNEETLLKYGYTKNEFLQLTIKDIRPKEDVEELEKAVESEEAYGGVHKKIWRHKKKNGEIMYMDISGHLINYQGRRMSFAMLIDITERLKLEEQNESEKREKEALINNTDDLIWSVSNDYKLIAANNSFINSIEAYTGRTVRPGFDLLNKEVYTDDVLKFWKNAYQSALKGKAFTKEFYSVAQGTMQEFWTDINFNPIYKDDTVIGVACYGRNVTDAKKAAEELKKSEEKYRRVFYHSPLPKWIYEIDTLNIVEVNDTAISHYGYTKEEFLKINIKDLRPKEDFEKFESIIKNVINEDTFNAGIVTHIKKNGERIKVEISGHKVSYQDKPCMIVICIDVTEREAALEILKDKDAKLENAQKIARLGYWQRNLLTNEIYWSKEIFTIWEISDLAVPDFNYFVSTIHPHDVKNYLAAQVYGLEINKEIDEEYRIIVADGSIKWIHEKAKLISNENGEAILLTGTAQDITERKNAEQIIFESNQRYEHVTKATYDAIWEWDVVSNKIYRAEGFERSFGFNLNEINSPETVWENFIHVDDRENASSSIQSAINSNQEYWSHEYRIIKPNGEHAYVEDRAYILRSSNGEAQRVIGALRDITERKYYHDLEMLEREVLEKNTQAEKSIEEVIGGYISGIQKLHPGMLCSMQRLNANRLYNLSSPNLPLDYLTAINGKEIGENEGSCGTAAFLKEKIIVSDIANDARWVKYKDTAAKSGLKACWSYPIFNSKNEVVATFAIYYNIIKTPTEQEENTIKRAGNILQTILESYHREVALQESNQRYVNVTKATFDAIWDWDIATNHVYWGEAYQQLFGSFEDDHLTDSEKVNARLHPDEKELVLESAKAALEGRELNWSMEHRYLKEDGTYAYVYNKALIVRDENDIAIRVFGAMQDITRQKEEEQRLKLMSSVVTSTNDAILITEAEPLDEPGPRIIYVNDAFCKMTGYTAEELVGQTPRILQGPKTDELELNRIGEALRKWEPCETTVINYKKSGEEFWINFTVSPVANEKGWYTHWISVERDVTERKNDELQKELLRKIRIIFNEPNSINETLSKVLKDVTLFGGFCFAESWLLSADKKEIKRATYYVADPVMRALLTETSKLNVQQFGDGLVGTAWKTLAMQTWENNTGESKILDKEVLINAGVKKLIALPFLNNAEIIGVLVFGLDKPEILNVEFENLFHSLQSYLGAEIKRKQLEQELNQIFNFAPDIITIVGKDGHFKKINPAASDLLEYSLQELMARPFNDFVHPEDKNKTGEELKDIVSGKTSFYFENRYITKSGKIKWLAWTSTPSIEEELIFAVAKNITEKKDLEVVLEKANQLARIGTWELDLETKALYWSAITKEIHETPLGFVPTLENATTAYKDGSSREEMIRRIERAVENGTSWDLEVEIITQKGNAKWIRSIGGAEFINGKCIKVFGSTQDINQRKRDEESIRSGEERRELIMNAALDAIICINKTGYVTFWNKQAEYIFGWTESEVMGKLLTKLIIPEKYKQRHENGMRNYFNTGSGQVLNALVQFSALRKTGEEFPIELTVLPIEQDGEKFFCAFVRDITERKLSETKLIELNHSLQKQTEELAVINKELEQFAYVASHDLQEPLRMVTSFITQLEKRYENVFDEKGKKYIYFAVDGARRMRQIILDLLEYSKVGRTEELKESIDINEVVDEIKILYSSKIQEQKAIITTSNLPVISSFKSPVKQVFQNLISNALKYCKENNPCRIHLTTTATATHWQFSIKDNGIGINKEYFDKIFVIFQRLHTKELYSGTGMGLAVTKKIIENLDGTIWVESTEGQGSIFYFTIPNT